MELRPLDRRSYAMKIPGFDREVRVTTSADVFDDHFESHDFLAPGGRVFEMLAAWVEKGNEPAKSDTTGRIWLI